MAKLQAMRSCLLLVSVAATVLLAACSDPPQGGELKVAVIGDGTLADHLAAEATRATLVQRGGNGELATGLATSWRFLDDGDALILRLAPLRWPGGDGKPGAELVANDIVNSLRRPRSDAARAVLAEAGLVGRNTARAPIARVVELLPRPPTPFLLDWLAEPALALHNRRGTAWPGPYTETRAEGVIRLDRRSADARPDARAARIRIEQPDVASAVRRFTAGDVHVVLGQGLAGLGTVRAGATGRALIVEPARGVIGLAINPNIPARGKSGGGRADDTGPLADSRLRRALLLAADPAAVANRFALSALQAQNRLWDGLPPPVDERALPRDEQLMQAAALLAAAGHGPDAPLTLTLLIPPTAEAELIAREVAASWAPLGIALKIVRSVQTEAKDRPRHDLALQQIVARVPDAVAHLARWGCGRVQPCSVEADRLIGEARRAGTDLATRAAAITAAESALMADPAFIPLLRPVRWALVASGVSGFETNASARHPLGRMAPPGAVGADPG
jgi:peptide/nickel transport system substrate-binding protein/oligopeptide transport system substrate-binding protein